MTAARNLATILFTDIVGSTERATDIGNRRWRELLERHHSVVRELLHRHDGVEINTAGDSFVARFDDPVRAIAAAWAIREAVGGIGLELRAGIHMGQVEGEGRSAVGIAVHVGARVSQAAEPGEILVSRSVHDAVEGGEIDFEDRGVHDLKGVPGDRRLFRVVRVPPDLLDAGSPWRRRLASRLPRRGLAAAGLMGAVALAALFLFVRDDAPHSGLPATADAAAAPAIAVLPFTVQGEGLEVWREGMVDVLSTNLDGAGGIRAIDSRTVLARWRESVEEGASADLARSLEVARRTGARYALLGSVVASGSGMRLVADLYDARSGAGLGRGQVEGSPDSIFGLVDRLSIEILAQALEEGEVPSEELRLASITTGSVSALKAYLEGESLFRRGEYRSALTAYQRALMADSTFALAAYRLSQAYGWTVGPSEEGEQAIERAVRFIERLPEKQAAFVRAELALERGAIEGVEIMREAVGRHPDDAEAWFLLGEMYFHLAGQALVPPGEADRAFLRAIRLDPRFAPAYIHRIHLALRYAPDSVRAAEMIATYGSLAGGTSVDREFETAFALAFGDSASRTRAWAALDTASFYLPFMVYQNLAHARFLDTATRVMRFARDSLGGPDPLAAALLVEILFHRGRLGEAIEASLDPALEPRRGLLLYEAHVRGLPIEETELVRELQLSAADTTHPFGLLYAGAFAAELGLWGDYAAAVEGLRARASAAPEQGGDSVRMRLTTGAMTALQGVGAWR
ncbi:MAG TPA: adenylate/guanylate cyclase domain-containing protein, partial [Gemmatimonadota bacterium]|nr:adenylate/guanylate cyclase domain-containing protein [Gemmatimonadota bacterium]